MEAICLHDILKDIASNNSDSMTRAATAARLEPRVDEWQPRHETPSLLSFTNKKENAEESHEDVSELLTRKFREFFP